MQSAWAHWPLSNRYFRYCVPASTGNSLAVASHRCAGRPCCIAVTCIQGSFNVSGCPQMNVSSSRCQEGRVPSAREPGTRNRSAALVLSASGPQSLSRGVIWCLERNAFWRASAELLVGRFPSSIRKIFRQKVKWLFLPLCPWLYSSVGEGI